MSPTLEPKDRIVVLSSAYGVFNPFSDRRSSFKAPERGDIVLMRLPSADVHPWHDRFADSALRFVTLQMVGLHGSRASSDTPVVKRVVAGPGDSVMMDGFVIYVQAGGSSHFLTEYEVSGGAYDIEGATPVEGWDKDMPLSGNFKSVTLGSDEFFVVGDNRGSSADSRFFGPVSSSLILGKVVFRYWPLARMSEL
jgi:signal peptidase I